MHLPRFTALPLAENNPDASAHAAAVALLFMECGNTPHIVLFRRSLKVKAHPGEIGLPGGNAEPTDQNLTETVLREVEEEIGITSENIQLLGQLPPQTTIRGQPVLPFVGVANCNPQDLVPDPAEVAEIIIEPWTTFLAENAHPFVFNMFGVTSQSISFATTGGHYVWGLTAKIIASAAFR